MAESFLTGKKTLWEKEKLLVTSNFSFSHGVFKRLVLETLKNQGLFGKGLNQSKFKALADNKINETQKLKIVLGRPVIIVWLGHKVFD